MRYIFFAPLPPLFPLLTTPEKGRNCPFSPLKSPSSPAAMRLFTSSLPPPLYPAFVPSPASLAYTIYRGALRPCEGGDANHYWSALGPVVVTHIDQ